jgi:aquaporin Z
MLCHLNDWLEDLATAEWMQVRARKMPEMPEIRSRQTHPITRGMKPLASRPGCGGIRSRHSWFDPLWLLFTHRRSSVNRDTLHGCIGFGRKDFHMSLTKKAFAEFIGTFWLVFGGCGSAVLAAAFPALGIGFLGVALAFGLTVLTMAFAIGHISGCHLNPAVSVGLVVGKRFPVSELPAYVIAQVLGAIAGSGVLYTIAMGKAGFDLAGGFASNGYGAHSPGGYSLGACLTAEIVLTFMFLMVILGATDTRAPKGFAPIAIGLGLTLIHLIGIPVTNLSANPARSTGPALFVGGWALEQLWLFWVAPIIGAVIGGVVYSVFAADQQTAKD